MLFFFYLSTVILSILLKNISLRFEDAIVVVVVVVAAAAAAAAACFVLYRVDSID